MIQVTAQTRILVAVEPADFRCGIDGLARSVRAVLRDEPMSGTVFVFRNRAGTAIKALAYDGQGYWLCQKRLSAGRFPHWPHSASEPVSQLEAHELVVLLRGGDPKATAATPIWRPVATSG